MKKAINKQFILSTLICFIPFIVSIYFYNRLPNEVAIHFDNYGNPDNYAPKVIAAFGVPLLMLSIHLYTWFRLENEPKKANFSNVIQNLSKWGVAILSVILQIMMVLYSTGVSLESNFYTGLILGIIVILFGNYLPKCKQNYSVGIKNEQKDKEETKNKVQEEAKKKEEIEKKSLEENKGNAETKKQTLTGEELKKKVDSIIPAEYKGNYYTNDVLDTDGSYVLSLQVQNASFDNESSCKVFTKDLINKLKEFRIDSAEIYFVGSSGQTTYQINIDDFLKVQDNIDSIDDMEFFSFKDFKN
ncbi:SdpI family protein [Clostridioides difficile]|uniref:SdpI family protein n=2 Tax=Clostridioides difficile TaxID=1496 RepID=UPI001FAE3298|nr:DUF1648 domain-containing protein [Clostridioides difficile]